MSNYLSNITHKHFGIRGKLQPRLPGWFEPWSITAQPFETIDMSPLDQPGTGGTVPESQQRRLMPQYENIPALPVPSVPPKKAIPTPEHNPEKFPSISPARPTTDINSPSSSTLIEQVHPVSKPTPIPVSSHPINDEILIKRTVLEEKKVIRPEISQSSKPPETVAEQQESPTISTFKSPKAHPDTASQPPAIVRIRPQDRPETEAIKAERIPPIAPLAPIPQHPMPPLPKKRTQEPIPANPAPTIQVSIGRIEVRATPPAKPAPKKRTTPPIMSLDDYLQQRRGGSDR